MHAFTTEVSTLLTRKSQQAGTEIRISQQEKA